MQIRKTFLYFELFEEESDGTVDQPRARKALRTVPAHGPRAVFILLRPWGGNPGALEKRGIENPSAWQQNFPFDKPVVQVAGFVNHLHCPPFVPEVPRAQRQQTDYARPHG